MEVNDHIDEGGKEEKLREKIKRRTGQKLCCRWRWKRGMSSMLNDIKWRSWKKEQEQDHEDEDGDNEEENVDKVEEGVQELQDENKNSYRGLGRNRTFRRRKWRRLRMKRRNNCSHASASV